MLDVCDWSSTLTRNNCRWTSKLVLTADLISFLFLRILEENPWAIPKRIILKKNPKGRSARMFARMYSLRMSLLILCKVWSLWSSESFIVVHPLAQDSHFSFPGAIGDKRRGIREERGRGSERESKRERERDITISNYRFKAWNSSVEPYVLEHSLFFLWPLGLEKFSICIRREVL